MLKNIYSVCIKSTSWICQARWPYHAIASPLTPRSPIKVQHRSWSFSLSIRITCICINLYPWDNYKLLLSNNICLCVLAYVYVWNYCSSTPVSVCRCIVSLHMCVYPANHVRPSLVDISRVIYDWGWTFFAFAGILKWDKIVSCLLRWDSFILLLICSTYGCIGDALYIKNS